MGRESETSLADFTNGCQLLPARYQAARTGYAMAFACDARFLYHDL